jgi:DUF4097 and DUF4098 domain-containing protein YvlB
MPTYATPAPISATARVDAGSIRFTAAERADTTVQVLPRDPKRDKDVKAAEQTEVTLINGVLHIKTRQRPLIGPNGVVDVLVDLPTGSRIDVTGSWTEVTGEGQLGDVHIKTSSGDVRLDATGPLHLKAAHGSITVEHIHGPAEITTSFGTLHVGHADGPADLKNSHGTTTVGTATGELHVRGAHGGIDIQCAEDSVTATVAHGTLRIAEVARGTVQLENSYGTIDVGIRRGTAAWLDVKSERGQVRSTLAESQGPAEAEDTEDTVKIHARTNWGNIDIHHAHA